MKNHINSAETDGRKPDEEKAAAIRKVLTRDRVRFLEATTKGEAIRATIEVLAGSPHIGDKTALEQAIFRREELMSTGIGLGLAVPHVRLASVGELVMAVGISRQGICDYGALDDQPVFLIFLIAAPEAQHTEYLRLLSAISSRAKLLKGRLLECADTATFYEVLTLTRMA